MVLVLPWIKSWSRITWAVSLVSASTWRMVLTRSSPLFTRLDSCLTSTRWSGEESNVRNCRLTLMDLEDECPSKHIGDDRFNRFLATEVGLVLPGSSRRLLVASMPGIQVGRQIWRMHILKSFSSTAGFNLHKPLLGAKGVALTSIERWHSFSSQTITLGPHRRSTTQVGVAEGIALTSFLRRLSDTICMCLVLCIFIALRRKIVKQDVLGDTIYIPDSSALLAPYSPSPYFQQIPP